MDNVAAWSLKSSAVSLDYASQDNVAFLNIQVYALLVEKIM